MLCGDAAHRATPELRLARRRLDVIDDEAEFYAVINNTAARVRSCVSSTTAVDPGTNILGCSWVAGNGMVLVRFGDVEDEGALWAHEYGHNAGLEHNPDSSYIMHACQCGGNRGLTQTSAGSSGRRPPARRSR